jgi:hypothetical protein
MKKLQDYIQRNTLQYLDNSNLKDMLISLKIGEKNTMGMIISIPWM